MPLFFFRLPWSIAVVVRLKLATRVGFLFFGPKLLDSSAWFF